MSSQWAQNARVAEILEKFDMDEKTKGDIAKAAEIMNNAPIPTEGRMMYDPETDTVIGEPEPYKPLHRQLKEAREVQGISLRKLGKMSGIDHTTIWRFEDGRSTLGLKGVGKICECLGIKLYAK